MSRLRNKRVPVGIAFFVLGIFVVIAGSTADVTDIGFTGRLSIGGEDGIEVNSLFYFGLALTGVGIIIILLLKGKNDKN